MSFNKIYFDYASTTPLDSKVKEAMLPYFREKFGNPGSIHFFGQEALSALDRAREEIAKELKVNFREIIFTGSATESNNLTLRGIVKQLGGSRHPRVKNPNIIISSVEHPSVFETARDLERDGVEIKKVPVNKEGKIDLDFLKNSLDENTILVSIMYANNEVGTLQPIAKISDIIKKFRNSKLETRNSTMKKWPFFHCDAVQAFQYFPCLPSELGIDLMTLSAHKIYGPKGIGLLYKKSECPLSPIITGGSQEFELRAGTENVASAVGFAKAIELVSKRKKEEYKRIKELGEYLWKGIKEIYKESEINGPSIEEKIPNIQNIYFPKKKAKELLIKFDIAGISVSAGSACKARSVKESRVISTLYSKERAESSIRFSLGKDTTREEIDKALSLISEVL
jgi:cysteine desulfurase